MVGRSGRWKPSNALLVVTEDWQWQQQVEGSKAVAVTEVVGSVVRLLIETLAHRGHQIGRDCPVQALSLIDPGSLAPAGQRPQGSVSLSADLIGSSAPGPKLNYTLTADSGKNHFRQGS